MAFFSTSQSSLLKLSHVRGSRIRNVLVWGFGAGIVGYLASGFEILQPNLQGSLTAGIAWPVILPRIIKAAQQMAGEEDEQPEQEEQRDTSVEEEEEE